MDAQSRKTYEIEGNRMRGLAVASVGATQSEVWEDRMAPGASTPPHSHDAEEIVVVVDGTITVELDGRTREARAGDAVLVPAGALHQLHNGTGREAMTIAVLGRVGARTFLPDGQALTAPWQD